MSETKNRLVCLLLGWHLSVFENVSVQDSEHAYPRKTTKLKLLFCLKTLNLENIVEIHLTHDYPQMLWFKVVTMVTLEYFSFLPF